MAVELSKQEVEIINNALNEVCNGIHLEGEFDTTIQSASTVLWAFD